MRKRTAKQDRGNPRPRVRPDGERPALRTADVGGCVLVYYDSVLQALGIDPATEPERPKTVTISKTVELMGLSRRTVTRMIADGRAEQRVRKPAREPHDNAVA
jgi:hypothetical protein